LKVILFGATGMVGQGVLRECLLDPGVQQVLAIGRNGTGQNHAKLRDLVKKDLLDFSDVEAQLSGYDACFFCLGVASTGMAEEQYTRITHDVPLAAAKTLLKQSPGITFILVSGAGADSTERGRTMWARVKGKTENDLLAMPFKAVFVLRPAAIQPLDGIKSRTTVYRIVYDLTGPILPFLKRKFPKYITTTRQIGKAMLTLTRSGGSKRVLENADINEVG